MSTALDAAHNVVGRYHHALSLQHVASQNAIERMRNGRDMTANSIKSNGK